MEFCPKCKSLMMVVDGKGSCLRCGHSSSEKMTLEVKEKMKEKKEIAVVDEKNAEVHPITDYECKKCGHDKSYFWTRQMRSGDEPESKFYKCVKCKNTVRED